MECLKCGLLFSAVPHPKEGFSFLTLSYQDHTPSFSGKGTRQEVSNPLPRGSALGCGAFSLTCRCGGESWGFVSSNQLSSWEKASVVKAGRKTTDWFWPWRSRHPGVSNSESVENPGMMWYTCPLSCTLSGLAYFTSRASADAGRSLR